MVPVIVLGGIYGGIMTPTEAAAVAAFYGLIVGMFVYREIDARKFAACCVESCETLRPSSCSWPWPRSSATS
jgi:TRAP-type C4-dicarboxylate transport system, large permease component